jgi:hypothetical protein
MTDRITNKTLDNRVENLNRRLCLTDRHVEWNARSGNIGLDEYRGRDCIRTLAVGTKREVADFLHAMMVGIDMSRTDA